MMAIMILLIPCRRFWIISKADLILMIMRMTNKYLIDIHDNKKSKHSNNHSQWKIAITM